MGSFSPVLAAIGAAVGIITGLIIGYFNAYYRINRSNNLASDGRNNEGRYKGRKGIPLGILGVVMALIGIVIIVAALTAETLVNARGMLVVFGILWIGFAAAVISCVIKDNVRA